MKFNTDPPGLPCEAWKPRREGKQGIEDENEMQADANPWAAEEGSSLPSMPLGRRGTSSGLNKLHAGRGFAFGIMLAVPRIYMFWGRECFLRFRSLQTSLVAGHL